MVDGGYQRDQSYGEHAPVRGAFHKEVDERRDGRDVLVECREDERCGGEREELDDDVEIPVFACPAHYEAAAEGAERCADCLGDEEGSGAGGGDVADDLKEDGAVVDQREGRHCHEPVCEAGGGDGLVGQEVNGNDGFRGDAGFSINKGEEKEEA